MLSVIVASYNYEKYISETLESLVSQTEEIPEIIVIDDGSTDLSIDVIKKFTEKYCNVKLIQHPDGANHGLASSLKLAINHAQFEYVAFCEADDFWDRRHYESLRAMLLGNRKINFITNKIQVINLTGEDKYEDYVLNSNKFRSENSGKNIFSIEKNNNIVPTFSCVCVKKAILERCNFETVIPQYIDYWLWRQILLKEKAYYTNDAITYWRKHKESYDFTQNVADLSLFKSSSDKLLKVGFINKVKAFFRL